MPRKILIAGGSGFLGRLLVREFVRSGDEPVILGRQSVSCPGARSVVWDGRTQGSWTAELEGADAVINLTGRSVDCRYTTRNRRQILESRLGPTRLLGDAIAGCRTPPRAWFNASTATIYRHSYDRPMDERTGEIGATPEARDAFSVEVASAWEDALNRAPTPLTRKIALRIAMVLSRDGGVYPVLRRLVRCGLGGAMGTGRQYVSWIHEEDFTRAVRWLLEHEDMSGAVNLAAPEPVTNRELMGMMRAQLGIPVGLPAACWMLELGAWFLRTETELILKSRRVVPMRLLESGFQFTHPTFNGALESLR